MAKILFGVGIADARNKLGGHVFSRNRNGGYVRMKVSPSQPRSASVLNVRANFTDVTKAWGGSLTDAERAAWNSLAASNPVPDQFGNPQTLTGAQIYMKVNRNLFTVGQARLDTAPSNLSATSLTSLSGAAAAAAATFTLTFTPTPLGADDYLVFYLTPQLSAGRTYFTPYLKIVYADSSGAATSPHDIKAAYVAKFGALLEGAKIGVIGFTINGTNGGASSPASALVTVAT